MTDRDPVVLAREVLEAQAVFDRDVEDAAHYGEVCDRLNEVVDRAAPDLARAVFELTAKVERMEALADRLERLAVWYRTTPAGIVTSSPYADGLDEAVACIRVILEGETHA